MQTKSLPLFQPVQAAQPALGVLSVHLDGNPCHMRCPFCYLGQRVGPSDPLEEHPATLDLLGDAVRNLAFAELAVALNEAAGGGVEPSLPALHHLADLCAERRKPFTLTTTTLAAACIPPDLLRKVHRLSLSIDPFKLDLSPDASTATLRDLAATCAALHPQLHPGGEIVMLVTLSQRRFAERLAEGLLGDLLAQLLDPGHADRLALSALKPPPAWCDRAFWLKLLSRLGPLLQKELNRRLFLDCYVAARYLDIGPCPARPDLSAAGGGLAFRSCVYQAAPDFVVHHGHALQQRLGAFVVPARCPFPVS